MFHLSESMEYMLWGGRCSSTHGLAMAQHNSMPQMHAISGIYAVQDGDPDNPLVSNPILGPSSPSTDQQGHPHYATTPKDRSPQLSLSFIS
jgi:hypothetical protein